MNSKDQRYDRSSDTPMTYRPVRAIVRLGVRLFCRKPRLLNQDKIGRPRPAILLVTHPRSLPVALLLVAMFDRPVRCLLPAGHIGGVFQKLAVWALGMRTFESLSDEQVPLLKPCLGVLANHGIVALFAVASRQPGGPRAPVADFAARLASEAILEGQGQVQPVLYPTHCFFNPESRKPHPLVYVEGPIQAHHFLPKVGEDVADASLHLAETVQKAMSTNIFGLAEPEMERFCGELEDLSREHLREQWSSRQDWRQQPEELHLSSLAVNWAAEQNRTDPARLVALRESLAAYREERRRSSMRQLIVAISGPWQTSRLRVAAAWFETVLEFPIALYGLINHLPAVVVLSASGFLKSSPKRDAKVEWLARIFVVLSFYTIQVLLVDFFGGRAAAGYYALTLPVSAACLWRYRWLARNRANILLLKMLRPSGLARLAKKRAKILERFGQELERSAQDSSLPYGQSPGAPG